MAWNPSIWAAWAFSPLQRSLLGSPQTNKNAPWAAKREIILPNQASSEQNIRTIHLLEYIKRADKDNKAAPSIQIRVQLLRSSDIWLFYSKTSICARIKKIKCFTYWMISLGSSCLTQRIQTSSKNNSRRAWMTSQKQRPYSWISRTPSYRSACTSNQIRIRKKYYVRHLVWEESIT